MNTPMLGTDPELVTVVTSERKLAELGMESDLLGLPMPAFYSLSIADPLNPDIPIKYGNLRADGMAAEFTVEPTASVAEMVARLHANLHDTAEIAARNGCTLSVEPNFITHPKWISRLDTSYGKACSLQILGCDPDFSIYGADIPDRPDPKVYNYRTSGGHIHVQIGKEILADRAATSYIIAAMDLVLGTAATFLCNSESAYDRKKLYGQAGMIRTNHEIGTVEYRTLPAQALVQTPELATLMFTAAQSVAGHMMDIYDAHSQPDAINMYRQLVGEYAWLSGHVMPAINSHNVDECRRIQNDAGNRLSSNDMIVSVINKLQAYNMPEGFDLKWEL